ncbi:hypothetical protein K458DRAFT_369239 [Lentithecium fluviatile CBS 122367]|uniref:C2 domain-containing protein n=1 Tax=Lentithecium fluviatile CBS 122367 TaxID=1168545 RepID=A0A6G1IY90_9PLEO|nr:hypothetical protein K458DRAFT_369239 [Lentithecium fluviatile CBS 122367]
MATKLTKVGGFGGPHTAGIFSDMTVDGPVIGTLVAIIDRGRNLPNRRSMGKQDPYCAARLGKEAKKTATDRRGGQTPKWDQELRFTVHDSPDYHQLKVSVFNDDKKTELIGETWVSLENIITPGGGQSDTWHSLSCKGKYAGDIRIELTFYDTRPKEEKAPAEKKESTMADRQSPAVGGPRESKPVKRRPLPTDPTGASPSPGNTSERRGLQGVHAGPRGYNTPPRQQRGNEQTPTSQRRAQHADSPLRRPLPEASPGNGTPSSNPHTPQNQQYAQRPTEQDVYQTPPNPRSSSNNLAQYNEDSFDMSYAAPKPYEMPPADSQSQHVRDQGNRTMSQEDFRSSRGHAERPPLDLPHPHSAPIVPTHHMYEPEQPQQGPYGGAVGYSRRHASPQPDNYSQDPYQDPSYQVEPLRLSRNSRSNEQMVSHDSYQSPNTIMDSHNPYDSYSSHGRRASSMQPTVEDEDDVPPPPPVHRSNPNTLVQPHQQANDYGGDGDAPTPLNSYRYREEQSYGYDSPPQPYETNGYGQGHHQERRYTHPRPSSRPVSRDTMAPSPLRNESAMIPASLIAGIDPSRQSRDSASYHSPPSYETPPRLRQHSEPDYRTPPQYDTPSRPHPLMHHESAHADEGQYYQHPPPEEPRRRSPVHDPAPIIKPRAVSPAVSPLNAYSQADDRSSRMHARSMPTRKSVSPRPPPSSGGEERRLSGVPFDPDSFDVFNPNSTKPREDPERPGSSMEYNDKGQIVTFSGRVIDASDHLPVDSWAPEPERKGTEKVRPVRSRPQLSGARDLEVAKQREERYRRERAERERIRNATMATFGSAESPSNALVTSRHNFSSHNSPANSGTMVLADRDATPPSTGRNRLQKRNQRPMSTTYDSPTQASPAGIPIPSTNILRERENLGGYGSSPGYGRDARHSIAAPPIPAKIPLDAGGGGSGEDMTALSLELQSIDIGPGSAGRRARGGGTTARRYGF